MRHADRRKVNGVTHYVLRVTTMFVASNDPVQVLGEAYRSSLHIARYRRQPGVQDDEGLPPEQLHEFCRYPSFDSALAFTVDARPTGRCTVAAPADKDFHVQPPFVRKALSWKAGTRKYARKDFTGAGYCLGVHAKSMSIAWGILPRRLPKIQVLFTATIGRDLLAGRRAREQDFSSQPCCPMP
jgi:hypothetical protein